MEKSKEKTAVYLNGRLVGFHEDGSALTASLREKRRSGIISRQSNFAYFPRERSLYINTDSGRARRPYIVVDKGKSRLAPEVGEKLRKKEVSWDYLITNGIIEYLDAEEEENAFVATREEELTDEHTHLEIDPVSIVGGYCGAAAISQSTTPLQGSRWHAP